MKFKYFLIIIFVLMFSLLSGCINNVIETTSDEQVVDAPLVDYSNKTNNNYYIQSEEKHLKAMPLSKEKMNDLMNSLESYWNLSSKYFSLSTANDLYGVSDLRKIEIDGEPVYYCIYENDELKLYLFFDALNNQVENLGDYRCYEYMCMEIQSSNAKVIKGNNLVEHINPLDL